MTDVPTAGAAIAAAARTINHTHGLDEALLAIAQAARISVPGFDEAGISLMHKDGRIETKAATGALVLRLDRVQYDLQEGPCYEALRATEMVSAPQLRHDQRWPRYVPVAVESGLRSQLAVRLYLDEQGVMGGLNLYSTVSEEIDPEAEATAELFATHAAIALNNAHERETLNEALNSRKVIGQAIGILMERYQMNQDRAFAFLVRASSHSNTKLRDIAQELVDMRNNATE